MDIQTGHKMSQASLSSAPQPKMKIIGKKFHDQNILFGSEEYFYF